MARGWENKAVESMMDDHDNRSLQHQSSRTPAQVEYDKKKASLELSRTGVLNELQSSTHPRRQVQLKAALKFLNGEIEKLGPRPSD